MIFSPEGDSSIPPAQVQARPIHKWPLRPGVLVHVNGTHSLNVDRGVPQQQYNAAVSSSTPINTPTRSNSSVAKHNMCQKDRIKTAAKRLKRRQITSMSSLEADDTNQHSRANRIRQMFSNDANKYHCETLPGVVHGKSGGKEAFLFHQTLYKKLVFEISYAFMNRHKVNADFFLLRLTLILKSYIKIYISSFAMRHIIPTDLVLL